MIEPAEEIYVIFNKKTGSIKTGGGRKYKIVHAYLSEKMGWGGIGRIGQFVEEEEKDDYAIAKYRLVEAKENRE
nr:MAG TPA: hypothetical protein [Caudoviricetes sp.]